MEWVDRNLRLWDAKHKDIAMSTFLYMNISITHKEMHRIQGVTIVQNYININKRPLSGIELFLVADDFRNLHKRIEVKTGEVAIHHRTATKAHTPKDINIICIKKNQNLKEDYNSTWLIAECIKQYLIKYIH